MNGDENEKASMTEQGAKPAIDKKDFEILVRANQGDSKALPELRDVLAEHPELVEHFGDLARHVRQALLQTVSRSSVLAHEAIEQRMAQLTEELGSSGAPKLEQMLIERIVLAWATLHIAELDALEARSCGRELGSYIDRRLSAAQSRYTSAIKQLAVVRKLLKPALSPIEMLSKPVNETKAVPEFARRSSRFRLHEAGIEN